MHYHVIAPLGLMMKPKILQRKRIFTAWLICFTMLVPERALSYTAFKLVQHACICAPYVILKSDMVMLAIV